MRLRCAPSEAPGMHTGALVCLVPPPASRPAASCSPSLSVRTPRRSNDTLHDSSLIPFVTRQLIGGHLGHQQACSVGIRGCPRWWNAQNHAHTCSRGCARAGWPLLICCCRMRSCASLCRVFASSASCAPRRIFKHGATWVSALGLQEAENARTALHSQAEGTPHWQRLGSMSERRR